MKNIFIITLGTREVQFTRSNLLKNGFILPDTSQGMLKHQATEDELFIVENNPNYPEYVSCSYPRPAGLAILKFWSLFENLVELPLIQNALENILKSYIIDQYILIYTDQRDVDNSNKQYKRNFNRDTLYFREIIRKKLRLAGDNASDADTNDIAITEKSTDIDFQYRDFAIKCKNLFSAKEEINQIFLLAQGGIDQINNALTLQLIQAFGKKVNLWQQAEGANSRRLEFPFLFINDLNRQKILKHLEDYDFGLICDFKDSLQSEAIELAQYGKARLNLDYSYASKYFTQENISSETKCRDLYLIAKIFFKRNDFGNYLWRLFTLLENIYRYKCEIVLGDTKMFFNPTLKENTAWQKKLNEIPGLYNWLNNRTINNKPIELNQPNRYLFKHAYVFFCKNNYLQDPSQLQCEINFIFNISQGIVSLRNKLAHHLDPISKDIIENSLKGKTCDELNKHLDFIFSINTQLSFGIFDEIRLKISEYI
jgi:hypothetical protein